VKLPDLTPAGQTVLERFQCGHLATTLIRLDYSSVYVTEIVDHVRRTGRLTELVEMELLELSDMPAACEAYSRDLSDRRQQRARLYSMASAVITPPELDEESAAFWPGGDA
jgi:hypothetical protein